MKDKIIRLLEQAKDNGMTIGDVLVVVRGMSPASALGEAQDERTPVDIDSFDDPSALSAAGDALSEDTSNDNAQFAAAYLYRQAALASRPAPPAASAFQSRVDDWMQTCFGALISANRTERSHRFLEEALELVQACGCTASEAHQLVDYVFGRPMGEKAQEVGGVMVTLAALCTAQDLDMVEAGETELARVWTKVEQIRAKQAAKPPHSPLPVAPSAAERATVGDERAAFVVTANMIRLARDAYDKAEFPELNRWKKALYAALESAPVAGEAQPVAWMRDDGSDAWTDAKKKLAQQHAGAPGAIVASRYTLPLYAAPQASPAADERDARDAERYRFLRDTPEEVRFTTERRIVIDLHDWASNLGGNTVIDCWSRMPLHGNAADAAIDAAISAQQGERGA